MVLSNLVNVLAELYQLRFGSFPCCGQSPEFKNLCRLPTSNCRSGTHIIPVPWGQLTETGMAAASPT